VALIALQANYRARDEDLIGNARLCMVDALSVQRRRLDQNLRFADDHVR
jgi:hypothetical protein